MAKYKLIQNGVLDQERGAHIPNDTDNMDWVEYLAWVDDGNTVDPMDVEPLSVTKENAKNEIDQVAGQARNRYITSVAGQEATYLTKYDEAKAYKDAGYPVIGDPNEYPHLSSEAGYTSQTEQQVADTIIATRDSWITLSSQIEGARMGGKKDIDDAVDVTGIDSAKAITKATLDGI